MSSRPIGDLPSFNSVGRNLAPEIQLAQTLKLPVPIVPTGLITPRLPSAVTFNRGVITVGSFPSNSFKKGGFAELGGRIEGVVRSRLTGEPFVQNDKTMSWEGVLEALHDNKKFNDGKPFDSVRINSHGGPGVVHLGNGEKKRVSDVVYSLVLRNHISKGGRIEFGGCQIAGNAQARKDLSAIAKVWGITITASEIDAVPPSPDAYRLVFYPNGQIKRELLGVKIGEVRDK